MSPIGIVAGKPWPVSVGGARCLAEAQAQLVEFVVGVGEVPGELLMLGAVVGAQPLDAAGQFGLHRGDVTLGGSLRGRHCGLRACRFLLQRPLCLVGTLGQRDRRARTREHPPDRHPDGQRHGGDAEGE